MRVNIVLFVLWYQCCHLYYNEMSVKNTILLLKIILYTEKFFNFMPIWSSKELHFLNLFIAISNASCNLIKHSFRDNNVSLFRCEIFWRMTHCMYIQYRLIRLHNRLKIIRGQFYFGKNNVTYELIRQSLNKLCGEWKQIQYLS